MEVKVISNRHVLKLNVPLFVMGDDPGNDQCRIVAVDKVTFVQK